MDHDKKLKEQFAKQFDLGVGGPARQMPGLAVLRDLNAGITQQRPEIARAVLTPEQREALAGKRLPAVRELLRRLSEGLEKHPEIARETHVTPQTCASTLAIYTGANHLLEGAGNAHEATLDGLRLVDDQGLTRGRHVLSEVSRMIAQRSAPDGDVALLEVKFAEAFSEYERATQTRLVGQDTVVREQREQADLARARAEEAQALGKLIVNRDRKGP